MELSTSLKEENNRKASFWDKFGVPILLLLATLLAYGTVCHKLGFFLDDWYIILFQQKFGPNGFWIFFSQDRPLEALPFVIFFSIFKDSALAWALFALVMRWVLSLVFWITLNKLFPKQRKLWIWASLIFTIYPGFKFHNFSIMFALFYVFFTFYILSFYSMGRAIEKRQSPWVYGIWTLLGIVCLGIGIMPVEYFFGLEFIRPILLWIIHARSYPKQGKKVFKYVLLDSLPYLLLTIGFVVFRVSQSHAYIYKISLLDQLKTAPFATIWQLMQNAGKSLFEGLILAWGKSFSDIILVRIWEFVGLLALSFTIIGITLLLIFRQKQRFVTDKNHGLQVAGTGILLSLLSLIPFYAGDFTVSLDFPWNRFLLAMMPGISLFTAGFFDFIVRNVLIKNFFFTALSVIAIGSHFLVGQEFLSYWNQQKAFFEQLRWRAPNLEPGTTLVTADLPINKYFSGTTLSGPVNLIFDPDNTEPSLNYFFILLDSNQEKYLPDLTPHNEISISLRTLKFQGNTDRILGLLLPETGCLQVLSDGIAPAVPGTHYPFEKWQQLATLSNPNLIMFDTKSPATLPSRYFGDVNTEQWCYYYQQADIARQFADWDGVIEQYQQAKTMGFEPLNGSEYRVLTEAWLKSKEPDSLDDLSADLSDMFPNINQHWCNIAHELLSANTLESNKQNLLIELISQNNCGR